MKKTLMALICSAIFGVTSYPIAFSQPPVNAPLSDQYSSKDIAGGTK